MKRANKLFAVMGVVAAGSACVVAGSLLAPVMGAAVAKMASAEAIGQTAVAATIIKSRGKKIRRK